MLIYRNIAMKMGTTKRDNFQKTEVDLAQLARALAHPARIAILKQLSCCDECHCGDIVGELPLSQATVSQHLKELKEVGLISGRAEGVRSCYCIDRPGLSRAKTLIDELFRGLNEKQQCC